MSVSIPKIGKTWQIDTIRAEDGTPIRYGLFQKTQEPDHLIFFVNGRSEWIEKYSFLPEALELPENCAFLTLDHRGQGASGGPRGDIDNYSTYVNDIAYTIRQIKGDIPYSLIAHSMGGLIGLLGTLSRHLQPQSIVLSSPLLGFNQLKSINRIMKPIFNTMSQSPLGPLASGLHTKNHAPFEDNPYTHDAGHYALLSNAPYRVPSPSFRWIGATLNAIDKVFDSTYLSQLQVPVLLLSGSRETVVNPRAFLSWIKHASRSTKVKISYRQTNGAKHELFNEINRFRKTSILATRYWMEEVWG